jgi:hypothetical protein
MADSCPNLEAANRLEAGDKIVKVVALLSSTGDVGAGGEPQIERSLICGNDKVRVGDVGILFGICQALLDILGCDKRLCNGLVAPQVVGLEDLRAQSVDRDLDAEAMSRVL